MVEIRFKNHCPHCREEITTKLSTDDTAGALDIHCEHCEGMFVIVYELRADFRIFRCDREPSRVEKSALVVDEKWKRDLKEGDIL